MVMPYLRRASLVLGSRSDWAIHFPTQVRSCHTVLGSELLSLSAIARTEDERSESQVASEIGHSQSTERAIARSVTVIALRNPSNPPSDPTPCDLGYIGRLGTVYIYNRSVYRDLLVGVVSCHVGPRPVEIIEVPFYFQLDPMCVAYMSMH